jgi:hypothetical protein
MALAEEHERRLPTEGVPPPIEPGSSIWREHLRIEPLREHLKIEQRENHLFGGAFHSRTDGRNIEHRSSTHMISTITINLICVPDEGQEDPSPILH